MGLTAKQREAEILHEMKTCVHFNGIQNEKCRAGVNMRELVGGSDFGWALRTPCMLEKQKNCTVVCESRQFPTREEAEREVADAYAVMDRTLSILHKAKEHAKEKGYGRGNCGKDKLPCPSGCGGTLHYSVASLNGHMWGRCTTEGCASWME